VTAKEQAEPNEPTGGERAVEGVRKDVADGAKPAAAGAKPAVPAKPAAEPKPAEPAKRAQPAKAAAEPAKPTEPAKRAQPAKAAAEPAKAAADPKPAAKASVATQAGTAAKAGAVAKGAGGKGAGGKDAPTTDAVTKAGAADKDTADADADTPTKVDGKPAKNDLAAAQADETTPPDAAKAKTAKPATAKPGDTKPDTATKTDDTTKVDDKTKVDVMASDGKPEPDDKPGKEAAARRADKNAPGKRWNRWYWVLGRGFATAIIGVIAILLGVFVLPKFVDTNVSANQGPPSPFATGPDIPGSLPNGGDLTGTPNPGTGMPTPNGPVQTQPGRPADALGAWAVNLSKLGIPQVALQSYGYAESVLGQTQPSCHLSWTMLAGIGSIESNHGRHGGATLQADGTSVPKILGVQLSGATTARIPDTDKGVLDQDTKFDRAMGAMQFIPSTWKKWGIDADNDGKADPFDLDDAAVSSGYYLCAGGRDLSTADGWWSAVLSYNNLTTYATNVYLAADSYGLKSTQ
jgi:hypothetical protein